MPERYDVAIIGGGIMGCSTAFQLAKRGLKVAVLEKGSIGAGSTGKSSAIIRQHYSNELTARMALHSLRVFQNFDEVVGGESGFTRTGFLVLVAIKDLDGLKANLAMQRNVGVKTELVSTEELNELMPGLEKEDLVAAAYEPESGYADPNLTVNAYAQVAKRLGARIFVDREVRNVRFNRDKVVGVETASGDIDAPVVLNSAGPWGARVAKMAGMDVPINACRVQVAIFRRPADHQDGHPVVADFIHAAYFRQETGGLTLVGLLDPSEANAIVDPDHFNEYVETDFVMEAGERLVNRFPAMEHGESRGGYAGLYAITPDWHPIVDELIEGSGFYICAGFSGHGFKLGPAVGVMAADLLTGEADPDFDPALFRLSRYAEEKAVRGQYEYSIAG